MPKGREPGLAITRGRGFQMSFPNGWTVSVQFGEGNYCQGYPDNMTKANAFDPIYQEWRESPDAEIAAWDKDGKWYRGKDWGDDVYGWVKPYDVAKFIALIANKV